MLFENINESEMFNYRFIVINRRVKIEVGLTLYDIVEE